MNNERIDLKSFIDEAVECLSESNSFSKNGKIKKIYKHHYYFIIAENLFRKDDPKYKSLNNLINNHSELLIDLIKYSDPDNIYNHFSNLNTYTKQRSTKLGTRGKAATFEGHEIGEFEILPLNSLLEIKLPITKELEGLISDPDKKKLLEMFSTTYKRIRSGNPTKINFKQYSNFINKLVSDIDTLESPRKNVYYYLIERELAYEFFKSVLSTYSELVSEDSKFNFKYLEILDKLILIKDIPALLIREELIQKFKKIDNRLDYQHFYPYIYEHMDFNNRFFQYMFKHNFQQMTINDFKIDMTYFSKLYDRSYYVNNFTIKKDFSANDFKSLMQSIKNHNKKIQCKNN